MALNVGTRLGPYEIVSAIGAGGMAEVYRARDTRLKRDVALKILPDFFASDPDRLARFQREAEVLASLNHPHIAAIYGLEESGGIRALVLELVEGDTLADRIAQGPIPLNEALPIAQQIAEALEAAHEQGIIHRDLKPANIKFTARGAPPPRAEDHRLERRLSAADVADGMVKVLDFGLAKLAQAPAGTVAGPATRSTSPTITSPALMTGVGVILGTAAYMAPEQAKGREADKRSDIWAFGCVLYEMLTGRRAFDGEDMTEVLGAVVGLDPNWKALSSDVPRPVRALLQSCLTKDRRRRVADISTALFVLEKGASLAPPISLDAAVSQAQADAAVSEVRRVLARSTRRRVAIASAAAVLTGAVVAGASVWVAVRPADPVPPRVSRLRLAPSGAAALSTSGFDRDLAITPDGSRVVYLGNRGTQLFVYALDALAPVAVFTGTPRGPFVSPDGQWIGFVDTNTELKKVAVTGGPAVTLATLDGTFFGATWAPDDTIIFATATPGATTGLRRVAAGGGSTTVLTRPDRAQGEFAHGQPEMLPGGRAVLFTIAAPTGGFDASQLAVLDLQTGTRTILMRGGTDAHFVPSGLASPNRAERDGGYLVYAAAGTPRAVPFDLASLKVHGTSVRVIPDVVTTRFGAMDAVVAGDGTLAYVSGSGTNPNAPRTLVWVDRQGGETPIPAPPRAYVFPRLSPEGTRVAVYAADQELDLWLWDLARMTLTRLTFEPQQDSTPVWTPDGRRLVFSSARAGALNLYVQAADGTGSATRLTESANAQAPTGIAADGTRVVFQELTGTRVRDLRLLTLTPTPRVEPLLETRFEERGGIVSPDGRWLAYESNSSGQFEIYVRPFPNVGDTQSQVSNAGGAQPLWARTGRELFYVAPDGALMTVPVEPRGTTWSAGTATKLVDGRYFTGAGAFVARQYDVSPDGQRFLMIKAGVGSDQTAAPPTIIVVQHWTEELKRVVPTK